MGRIVFLLLLLGGLAWWMRGKFFQRRANGSAESQPLAPQRIVCCQECGVHIPENEAVRRADGTLSCVQHADSAPQ